MTTLPRNIGFEIEFAADTDILPAIKAALEAGGQTVSMYHSYRHSNGRTWDLKLDSSCGYEVASPIIQTYQQLLQAAKVVEIIRAHGGTVNQHCGLHVHVDMNGLTPEIFSRIMSFMTRYEEGFFLLADTSRQSNTFCRRLSDQPARVKKSPTEYKYAWNDKYYWLNGTHLRGQGTIEFRLMASHLEPEYITGWVMFLLHAIEYLIQGKKVSWGKAACSNARDLLQTMLGQAGFYGPFDNREKASIVLARKWAIGTYTRKTGQSDTRVKCPSMVQFESMAQ